jgi:GH24 family phage-related lysozyme (muramidase)
VITDISPEGIAFTTREEGGAFRHVYLDSVNVPTWGVGCILRRGDPVPCGPPYCQASSDGYRAHAASGCPGATDEAIESALRSRMAVEVAAVVALSRRCTLIFTQGMFDALCDLAYNEGPAVCLDPAQSHLAAALVAGDKTGAAQHLLDWDKAGGQVSPGLAARRKREQALFLG